MSKRMRKFWFRGLLALISSVILLIMLLHTTNRYLTTPGLSIRDSQFIRNHFTERKVRLPAIKYNDLTDGGMQVNLTLSNNLFQVALLVTAGLAGLLIARDNEAKFVFGGSPEIIMSIGAALLLGLSFVSHILYLKEVSYLYFLAGRFFDASNPSAPDLSDVNVNFLLTYQLEYLVCGTIVAAFTFFSAHKLKGGKTP